MTDDSPKPYRRVGRERAARREFLTAMAAVIVTGVVGLGSVVVSCQSSRDSQRTTREAQRETTRAERTQADLAELRAVLDRATADLERLRVKATDAALPRSGARFRLRPSELALAGRNRRWMAPELRATQISGARLLIRLGARSDAVTAYLAARDNYDTAAGSITLFEPGSGDLRDSNERKLAEADEAAARFAEEARELVGTQLPD